MNSKDKLRTLQDVLQGETSSLYKYKRQHQKETVPYLDVQGILNLHSCPPILLDLWVCYSYFPTLRKCEHLHTSLAECIQRHNQTDLKLRSLFGGICGLIRPENKQYDDAKLAFIQVRCRDCEERSIEGGTIQNLRYWYSQSADSFNESPYLIF